MRPGLSVFLSSAKNILFLQGEAGNQREVGVVRAQPRMWCGKGVGDGCTESVEAAPSRAGQRASIRLARQQAIPMKAAIKSVTRRI